MDRRMGPGSLRIGGRCVMWDFRVPLKCRAVERGQECLGKDVLEKRGLPAFLLKSAVLQVGHNPYGFKLLERTLCSGIKFANGF